jgi:5'-3' exoribonuclease 1
MLKSIEDFVLRAREKKNRVSSDQEIEGVNRLSFVNSFPARDKAFLTKIAQDLHLELTWDEYDEQDRNLAVLRIPSLAGAGVNQDDDDSDEDEDEGRIAVDRILFKYNRMSILEDEGTSEERYEAALKGRMDTWKRDYYRVCQHPFSPGIL